MAFHPGRRAGRGLGPGDPGLRRPARRHGHRAHRAGGRHAGARPPAHQAPGKPGPAGPPHADHRHHQPGPRRPGRGRGAVQGARGPGRRPAAHRHGAQAARSFRLWSTGRVRPRAGARRRRRGGRRLPRRADSIPGRDAGRRPRRGHALAQPASRPGSRPGWPGGADQRAGRLLPGRAGDRGRRRGRVHQGRAPLVPRGQPGGRRGRRTPGRLECRGRPDRPPFYRLADLRLRGLLHLLRDDPRVQTFAERELGRCSPPSRTRRCSMCSRPTSRPAATRRRRPRARTWPGRRSTSGSAGSSESSAPTWVRPNPGRRCTWRCWRWTRPGGRARGLTGVGVARDRSRGG